MVTLPKEALYTDDIVRLAKELKIDNFEGVKMRDEIKGKSMLNECGIINLNTSYQSGSHWTCFYHDSNNHCYYFDSFGEPPPVELLKYLKSDSDFNQDLPSIKRNSLTVQHDHSSECGSLCLYVLKQLSEGIPFPDIIIFLDKRYRKFPTTPLKCRV